MFETLKTCAGTAWALFTSTELNHVKKWTGSVQTRCPARARVESGVLPCGSVSKIHSIDLLDRTVNIINFHTPINLSDFYRYANISRQKDLVTKLMLWVYGPCFAQPGYPMSWNFNCSVLCDKFCVEHWSLELPFIATTFICAKQHQTLIEIADTVPFINGGPLGGKSCH